MLRNVMFKNLGFERLRITSPRLYHTKINNFFFKKTGGLAWQMLGAERVPTYCGQAIKKKWEKKQIKIDNLQNFWQCIHMENKMTVLKINKFKSVVLVSVTYRLANGEVRVASGKTESEAMANMTTETTKSVDFAPLAKRSNSGTTFRNNRGMMVEVWKKSEKKVDRKRQLD